jgi:uncharacterized membrane protein
MSRARRLAQNLLVGWWRLARWFPRPVLHALRDEIAKGEREHDGEICFAVESRLAPLDVLRGLTPRARAEQVFARLRVWDTERNTGVLIYLLLAERAIEIVADRAIAARVPPVRWQAMCDELAAGLKRAEPALALRAAIAAMHAELRAHFPAQANNVDERPNEPVIL